MKLIGQENTVGITGEIVVYQPDEITRLEVRVNEETVWLNRQQLATLFGRDVKTIGKHINNALNEELKEIPTIANFATVQVEGGRYVTRDIEYYSLDMIISIGYRVKSRKGILFRRWANSVLKEYMTRGISINQHFIDITEQINKTLSDHKQRLDAHERQIDFFIQSNLPPKQGIFFDGQIYDAYTFVADLVRKAQRRIVLKVYLIGASIKDLGKKWFGFTLMENTDVEELLGRI